MPETPLTSVGLSTRSATVLIHGMRLFTCEETQKLTDFELLRQPNFGPVSLDEVRAKCGPYTGDVPDQKIRALEKAVMDLKEALQVHRESAARYRPRDKELQEREQTLQEEREFWDALGIRGVWNPESRGGPRVYVDARTFVSHLDPKQASEILEAICCLRDIAA